MATPFDTTLLEPFGVEVDVDLSRDLEPDEQAQLRDLFANHLLILARNQKLDRDGHRRVMSYLGPVPSDPRDQTAIISTDAKVGIQGSIKLAFHSDLAYNDEPDHAVSLHAVELTNGGSSTLFANAITTYAALPADLKSRIDGLMGLNVWVVDQTRRTRLSEISANDPRTEHPIVGHHPVTGLPYLYVTEMQTDSLVGLAEDESEALLTEIKQYLYDPSHIYQHWWNVGDLLVWDNRAVQHARDDLSEVPGVRTLLRAVCNSRGFFEQNPQLNPDLEGGFVDERHADHTEAAS